MRTLSLATLAILTTWIPAQEAPVDYVVLAAVGEEDPFDAAARALAAHHSAPIVRFDVDDLESVRARLAGSAPRNVALVMRPEQIDYAFARRFLQLASEIDEDPFVDFAFGYITGRTAEDALALATRGIEREPKTGLPRVASVIGGLDQSVVVPRPHRLRGVALDGVRVCVAGETVFPDEGRDRAFLAEQLPALAGRDVVTFVGHGYPREVVGGPTFADLRELRLEGAVALNVACYTGVTARWFEDDYRTGVVSLREVPLEESFGLTLLRTGVVGYTAYLCPRPAGPELDTDLAALVADGLSLGEARRRDYDKTVLGFLGFGEDRMELEGPEDGQKLARHRDPVRDMMLEGATGGVLFGDPACVPFAGQDGEAPVAIDVEETSEGWRVEASAALIALYLHCADPTAKFGETMAMKVHARLPVGDHGIEDVVVDELRVAREELPTRVLWAIEDDHGERFLQLKVNFPRKQWMRGNLSMVARVIVTADPEKAKRRGGEIQAVPVVTADIRSRELQPVMLERAIAREVSREAVQAALDASALLLGDREVDAGAMDRLASFESEGFRAVCILLEIGHAHHRTWQLLKATWQPGDERHLIELATRDELPNHASWQVLEGLGVADTPEVRAYLLDRLAREENAGLYMSTAEGLAHLGAREAAAAIGDRVLEFRDGWSGVEPHLIVALGELGGPEAIDRLERISLDPRAGSWQSALLTLERLDPAAAERVRAKRPDGR